MNLIQAFVEVALVASGLFFFAAAFMDGRRQTRPAGAADGAVSPLDARSAPTLVPRTIRSTALD
jgi:hypothetical protein